MKVTVILVMIDALGINPKGLIRGKEKQEIKVHAKTLWTSLLRLARILRRVLETWGDLLSLRLQWKFFRLIPRERYEHTYPPGYGLNYCPSTRMALALNSPWKLINKETKLIFLDSQMDDDHHSMPWLLLFINL